MAIRVEHLHYAFRQEKFQTDSEALKEMGTVQVDYYLNRAKNQLLTILTRVVEEYPEVENWLQQVMERGKELELEDSGKGYVVAKFPDDYHRAVRRRVIASCANCEPRELIVRTLASNKVDVARLSADQKPSFEYEQTLAISAADGMHVYYDGFNIDAVYLDYVRTVADVAAPSLVVDSAYVLPTGETLTQNIDLEIDAPYFADRIPKLAALMALNDSKELSNYQSKYQEIIGLAYLPKTQ